MALLSKEEIVKRFQRGELIDAPRRKDGDYDVQPSSYDLSAGIIVRRTGAKLPWQDKVKKYFYDPSKSLSEQDEVTIEPGQMMFVITQENVIMPKDLCGTVYSKNNLSRDGILALTTGHVDPGYKGAIVIRLINLKATDYTLALGKTIYTITFEELKYNDPNLLKERPEIPREDMLKMVMDSANSALSNTLHDMAMLHGFVKKEEFGRSLRNWLFGSAWRIIRTTFASVLFIFTVAITISKVIDLLKKWELI